MDILRCRQLYLRPEQKHPKGFGLYLFLCKGGPVKACIAHMSFTMYDRQEPDNNLYGSALLLEAWQFHSCMLYL